MESSPRARQDSAWRLGFKVGAIVFFGLFMLAANTVSADAAGLPPILLFIAVAFVICLL